jgi:hypothetical protein
MYESIRDSHNHGKLKITRKGDWDGTSHYTNLFHALARNISNQIIYFPIFHRQTKSSYQFISFLPLICYHIPFTIPCSVGRFRGTTLTSRPWRRISWLWPCSRRGRRDDKRQGGAVDCHGGYAHRGLGPRPAQVGSKGRRPHGIADSKVWAASCFQSGLCSYVVLVLK